MNPACRMLPFFIAFLITALSLFVPHSVTTQQRARSVRFGFPFSFVEQDMTTIDRNYPAILSLQDPWENPTKFSLVAFLFNVTLFASVGYGSLWIFQKK